MIGYYVEITAQHAKKLGEKFIHRQTMANAMRFTTAELSELQSKIISARDEALQLELQIFSMFVAEVQTNAEHLSKNARSLAFIDVISSFAELSKSNNYTRPKIDDSQ